MKKRIFRSSTSPYKPLLALLFITIGVLALLFVIAVVKKDDGKAPQSSAMLTSQASSQKTSQVSLPSSSKDDGKTSQSSAMAVSRPTSQQAASIPSFSAPVGGLVPPSSTSSVDPVKTENKTAYLTFDDGPSKNTPKILDILKKKNAKATFFVIATDSPEKGEMYKRILEEGHTLAIHAHKHEYNQIYKSVDAYMEDLEAARSIVKKYTGYDARIFRFPGGSNNYWAYKKYKTARGIIDECHRRGYEYFDWNVESGDADKNVVSASAIRNKVVKYASYEHEAVVLMHDAPIKTTTVDALPGIIDSLKNKGFDLEPITNKTVPKHFALK
jgi:peptidoglycan/xylan/chitin deacetylase (PgdA/CDA1 family)